MTYKTYEAILVFEKVVGLIALLCCLLSPLPFLPTLNLIPLWWTLRHLCRACEKT